MRQNVRFHGDSTAIQIRLEILRQKQQRRFDYEIQTVR
jgi:hypothetical protein